MGIIARATRSCSHMCCCNLGVCARVFSVESSVKRGLIGEKFYPDVVTVGSRNLQHLVTGMRKNLKVWEPCCGLFTCEQQHYPFLNMLIIERSRADTSCGVQPLTRFSFFGEMMKLNCNRGIRRNALLSMTKPQSAHAWIHLTLTRGVYDQRLQPDCLCGSRIDDI